MELIERQFAGYNYNIYLPRNYLIKTAPINTGFIYYIVSNDENIEIIHSEIYIGFDQIKKDIMFDHNDIIESIESNLLNKKTIWPIYYSNNKYHTGIIFEIGGGAVARHMRILGTENSKEDIIDLINIFSTLR